MSMRSKILERAREFVYDVSSVGEGGHIAVNWARSLDPAQRPCKKCTGFLKNWPKPVDLHMTHIRPSAWFSPWYMHIFCVQRQLAEGIRPHLKTGVWGSVRLALDDEIDGSTKYERDQFHLLDDYESLYTSKEDSVQSYGIRHLGCQPSFCEPCGQMYGLVWVDDAFILDTDWNAREAGLRNGHDLLLSQKLFEKLAWSKLKPVSVHPIPVVAREDLPAEIQEAYFGGVVEGVKRKPFKAARTTVPAKFTGSLVRLDFCDVLEDAEPAVKPDALWLRSHRDEWCCRSCGCQRASAGKQRDMVVRPGKVLELTEGEPEHAVLRVTGTRIRMYHRNVVNALRKMKKDLRSVVVTGADGTSLPYEVLVGVPHIDVEMIGGKSTRCEACGERPTASAGGFQYVSKASIGKEVLMQDADGWLCLPEKRVLRFQKAIGQQMVEQLSEQWIAIAK